MFWCVKCLRDSKNTRNKKYIFNGREDHTLTILVILRDAKEGVFELLVRSWSLRGFLRRVPSLLILSTIISFIIHIWFIVLFLLPPYNVEIHNEIQTLGLINSWPHLINSWRKPLCRPDPSSYSSFLTINSFNRIGLVCLYAPYSKGWVLEILNNMLIVVSQKLIYH